VAWAGECGEQADEVDRPSSASGGTVRRQRGQLAEHGPASARDERGMGLRCYAAYKLRATVATRYVGLGKREGLGTT
jgi:hypothetical protein